MDYSAVSQAAKKFEQESKVNHEIREIKQKMMAGKEQGTVLCFFSKRDFRLFIGDFYDIIGMS